MTKVFVLDKNKTPLIPCHPARARILLSKGRAVVFKLKPFTIIIKDRLVEDSVVKKHKLKIDPGSQTTGISINQPIGSKVEKMVFGMNLEHRGDVIRKNMYSRGIVRRLRRRRKTRYRQRRFLNRVSKLRMRFRPSLESRMGNIITWTKRFLKLCPINSIYFEKVNFDIKKMGNYEGGKVNMLQKGATQDYDTKQYLLEKWNYKCAYCSESSSKLQVEHVVCKERGGSSKISNLVVSCKECNDKKGKLDLDEFLWNKPDLLQKIKVQLKTSLKDVAAVDTIKNETIRRLRLLGQFVEIFYGCKTSLNRKRFKLLKDHYIDASCIGADCLETIIIPDNFKCFSVKSMGNGNRQMCGTDKYGFPIRHRSKSKFVSGYKTGDICMINIENGKYKGIYVGRITVRATGVFNINGIDAPAKSSKTRLFMSDGYRYF